MILGHSGAIPGNIIQYLGPELCCMVPAVSVKGPGDAGGLSGPPLCYWRNGDHVILGINFRPFHKPVLCSFPLGHSPSPSIPYLNSHKLHKVNENFHC